MFMPVHSSINIDSAETGPYNYTACVYVLLQRSACLGLCHKEGVKLTAMCLSITSGNDKHCPSSYTRRCMYHDEIWTLLGQACPTILKHLPSVDIHSRALCWEPKVRPLSFCLFATQPFIFTAVQSMGSSSSIHTVQLMLQTLVCLYRQVHHSHNKIYQIVHCKQLKLDNGNHSHGK